MPRKRNEAIAFVRAREREAPWYFRRLIDESEYECSKYDYKKRKRNNNDLNDEDDEDDENDENDED